MGKTRRNHSHFDPASLDDAIATQTSWKPTKAGSAASFCTHRLASVNTERMEFYATPGAKLFCWLGFVIGLIAVLSLPIFLVLAPNETLFIADFLIQLLFSSMFALVGANIFYWGSTPIVFDYDTGFFWRGRQAPKPFAEQNVAKHFARLDRIYALQLLSQYHCSKPRYYSYQLNLILKDGQRINVLNHGNEQQVRSDAAELAAFLGSPVWDGI